MGQYLELGSYGILEGGQVRSGMGGQYLEPGSYQKVTSYRPVTYRVEYLPPNGQWTFLAREYLSYSPNQQVIYPGLNSNPQGRSPDQQAKTYTTPAGVFGTWRMRAVLESSGEVTARRITGRVYSNTATLTGKNTSRYVKSYRIPLTGKGPWSIRVTRLTPDSHTDTLANETWWDSYTEVVNSRLSYPYSCVAAMTIEASQFPNPPSRGYRKKGTFVQVPSNYDPVARTYSGLWDGTFKPAATQCPPWIYYDIVMNDRYGLGSYVNKTTFDKWTLYEIAKYCDELVPSGYGYLEPRYTCNVYIQKVEEAFRLLTSLSSMFRSAAYWGAGQALLTCDMPAQPLAPTTNANVINGEFVYSGTSLSTRHNVVHVTWNDPSEGFLPKIEAVEDPEGIDKFGVKLTSVVAFGCTSRGQARRYGRSILYTEKYEGETCKFNMSLESINLYPGAVVPVMDRLRSLDRLGGRVVSATTTTVKLDSKVKFLEGKIYRIAVTGRVSKTLPNGQTSESVGSVERTLVSAVGELDSVIVFPAFDEAPQEMSAWIVYSNDIAPQLMRVVSVKESSTNPTEAEVLAIAHYPKKYDYIDFDVPFDPPSVSGEVAAPPIPKNLKVVEELYLQSGGILSTRLNVSWEASAPLFDGNWTQGQSNPNVFQSKTNSVDLAPVSDGPISIKVRSLNSVGRKSDYAVINYTVLGKLYPPSPVLSLIADVTDAGVSLSWEVDKQELDFKEYVIYVNDVEFDRTASKQYLYRPTPLGLTKFSVAVRDTSNKLSSKVSADVTITAPEAPTVSYRFSGEYIDVLLTKPTSSLSVAYYEMRSGSDWLTGSLVATSASPTMRVRGSWLGEQQFTVAAYDIKGNLGAIGSVAVVIEPPKRPYKLDVSVVDNNVLLYWASDTGSLPIVNYEVRRGEVVEGSVLIGLINSGFVSVFEPMSGSFNYFVRAIDSAGNFGEYRYTSCAVSEPPDYVFTSLVESVFDVDGGVDGVYSRYWNAAHIKQGVYLPIDTEETWEQHFTSNSWLTPQDQIDAGYPIYLQPGKGTGFYEEIVDHREIVPATKISVEYVGEVLSGNPNIAVTISTKETDDVLTDISPDVAVGGVITEKTYLNSENIKQGAYLPVDTVETWEQHFTSNSWLTPQDQIDAGYPIYLQPGKGTGFYEVELDFGEVYARRTLFVDYVGAVVAGIPEIRITISAKRLSTDTWREFVAQQTFVNAFRYVKVRFEVVGVVAPLPPDPPLYHLTSLQLRLEGLWTDFVGPQAYVTSFRYSKVRFEVKGDEVFGGVTPLPVDPPLYHLTTLRTKLDTKVVTERKFVQCDATDADGTIVSFDRPFVDVNSISITPEGVTGKSATWAFRDANEVNPYTLQDNVLTISFADNPYVVGQDVRVTFLNYETPSQVLKVTAASINSVSFNLTGADAFGRVSTYPASLRIYVYDSNGARISGLVSYSVQGVQIG